jgi:hypothetical protein
VHYFQATQSSLSPTEICAIINASCTGPNQAYTNYQHCISYLTAMQARPDTCPSGYLTNHTSCYTFHTQAATILPNIHCMHIMPGPDTPKCCNFCIKTRPCSSCHPNTICTFATPFGQTLPEYACQCKEGYTSNSTISCQPNTCLPAPITTNTTTLIDPKYQCPSPQPIARMASVPMPTLLWLHLEHHHCHH